MKFKKSEPQLKEIVFWSSQCCLKFSKLGSSRQKCKTGAEITILVNNIMTTIIKEMGGLNAHWFLTSSKLSQHNLIYSPLRSSGFLPGFLNFQWRKNMEKWKNPLPENLSFWMPMPNIYIKVGCQKYCLRFMKGL